MPVLEMPIKTCRPSRDTVPYSECRNNLATILKRTHTTHRPVLVTQNGNASNYIIDAADFDNLMERIELWNDVAISRREIAEGKGISNDAVFAEMSSMLNGLK